MSGEKNLDTLLTTMQPILQPGDYVFCTEPAPIAIDFNQVVALIQEPEGRSLVLLQHTADQWGLSYSFIAAWITLTVHSSLEAVGLTAAFSHALANAGISCNVVAGYYHDHIFVDKKQAELAMHVLRQLSESRRHPTPPPMSAPQNN